MFEVTLCREGFFTHVCRVTCTVKSCYWHLWMLLFIHKWLAMVGAISSVALQDPGVPQKGVFLLSHVFCELPGIGVGAGLILCRAVCSYVPNRQKLNSRWGRLWHQESSTILSLAVSLSFLLFNFLLSMGWNVSITLFYFTCVQGLAERIVLDAKSKPWSLSPQRWQFWHLWRVQSRGATFFALVKRGTSADSVELCSFTQRR